MEICRNDESDHTNFVLLGFEYVNDGHDMKGNVHEIYSKISHFIMNKGEKFKNNSWGNWNSYTKSKVISGKTLLHFKF